MTTALTLPHAPCANRPREAATLRPSLCATILAEVLHRTANDYASALAALNLARPHVSGRGADVLAQTCERIAAAAELHRILIPPLVPGSTELSVLLKACCDGMRKSRPEADRSRLTVTAEPVRVDAEVAWLIVAAAAELIRNARRHAFGGSTGDITVDLRRDGDTLALCVSDDGVGAGNWVSQSGGSGGMIVDAIVNRLDAVIVRVTSERGTLVRITMELPNALQATCE